MFDDPGVGLDLLERYALFRVQHEELWNGSAHLPKSDGGWGFIDEPNQALPFSSYPLDQIPRLGAHKRRDAHVAPDDPPLRHDLRIFEWRFTNQEFISQDAQTPQINLFVVRIVRTTRLDHLGREVVKGTTHRLATAIRRVNAPAKIGDFDFPVDADEDVFGLNVAVDNMFAVEITQRGGHLRNILRGLPLGKPVLAAQVLIQLSLTSKLQNQKHALAIVEVSVKLKDVGVAQIALDLDFAAHLLLDAAVLELVLVQDLEGADEPTRAFLGEVDAAEFSFA